MSDKELEIIISCLKYRIASQPAWDFYNEIIALIEKLENKNN